MMLHAMQIKIVAKIDTPDGVTILTTRPVWQDEAMLKRSMCK